MLNILCLLLLLLWQHSRSASSSPLLPTSFYEASGIGSFPQFNWTMIRPITELEYHPCYDGFQCARLQVPMDWQNATNRQSVAIAIIKLPATVQYDDARFGGTIVTNPGGPGISGIQFLLMAGRYLQNIADTDSTKYEILSFDPRGVWQTTPPLDCFYRDPYARQVWDFEISRMGLFDSDETFKIRQRQVTAHAFGTFCSQAYANQGGDSIMEHLSTAVVARDLLEITEKIAMEKDQKLAVNAAETRPPAQQTPLLPWKMDSHPATAKLQYWGFSYGTHLGNTFASIWPHRVRRLILDGVVDSYDFSNAKWEKSLIDTETVVGRFFQACFEAKNKCPLYRDDDQVAENIKDRLFVMFEKIHDNPLPVIQGGNLTLFTWTDLTEILFSSWYSPLSGFPRLASMLADISENKFDGIMNENITPRRPSQQPAEWGGNTTSETLASYWAYNQDTSVGVMCGDAFDNLSNTSTAQLQAYVKHLHAQSSSIGRKWATWRILCSGWPVRARWQFSGPFTTPLANSSSLSPEAPFLFLSSKFDPITPLQNSVEMARGHPHAVVVSQNSYGHSATFAAPSNCTISVIRNYLESGMLPVTSSGIFTCDADCSNPWHGCSMKL